MARKPSKGKSKTSMKDLPVKGGKHVKGGGGDLQSFVSSRNQSFDLLTNIIKSNSDTASAITKNIK